MNHEAIVSPGCILSNIYTHIMMWKIPPVLMLA